LVLIALLYRQRSLRNERRLAQEKVALLEREKRLVATQAVMEGETAERSRLARDLHDGLGGMLSVIKLNLHQVKKSDLMVPDDVGRLDNVLGLLDQSMQELRRVAHNMMPEALVKYGLKAALADFCRNIENAHYHYFGEEKRLDPNLEVTVYRTAFELVNNALKHAEAKAINIQVVQQSDRLALTVHDDGKGFDTKSLTHTDAASDKSVDAVTGQAADASAQKPSGHGLSNIANRAAAYGGTMDILSAPGQGTEITVEFLIQQVQ
ncbi:MAG: sensor histidine kinase, partial [Bacteroidales bacterium]|nr:sensor histidine kinase [Bacteroidales bacterium]